MALEKKLFTGALDTDIESRLLAPGDYRYALNVRSGSAEDADIGAITNVKGNTLISFDLPAGLNRCMGTHEDEKNKRVLYLVYNSNTNHQILEYSITSNAISLILQSKYINLDPDYPVLHMNLIDDKLFYWTDNFGDPHKVNLDRARRPLNSVFALFNIAGSLIIPGTKLTLKYSGTFPFSVGDNIILSGFVQNSYNTQTIITEITSTYFVTDINYTTNEGGRRQVRTIDGYPSLFKKQHLDAISYPPLCPPTAEYKDDLTVRMNNLRGSLFQFKIQYVYADAEKSAWSPISKLPLPTGGDNGEENFANAQHIPETSNNKIELRFSTGDAMVRKINIAARFNRGDFFLIRTLEKNKLGIASDSFDTYDFYNDGIYSSIELKESIKLFDWVPKKAATQEFIDGNKLAYGNILEGFDPVDVDMEFTPKYNNAFVPTDTPQPTITMGTINIAGDFITINFPPISPRKGNLYVVRFAYNAMTYGGSIQPANPSNFSIPYYKNNYIDNYFKSGAFVYTYTVKQGDTINNVVQGFVVFINNDASLIQNYERGRHHDAHIGVSHHPHIRNESTRVVNATNVGGELILTFKTAIEWFARENLLGNIVDRYYFGFYGTGINSDTTKIFETAPIQRAFKRGANHEFGIGYFDFANRSGHVNIAESVYVKFFTETTEKGHVDMDIEINHQPPAWATHYQIYYAGVKGKGANQTVKAFIQGITNAVTTDTIGSNITVYKLSLDHILNEYKTDNPNSILSFLPKAGDRIRFIKYIDGSYWNTLADVEIMGFDLGTSEITIPDPVSIANPSPNMFFEIYSPKKDIEEKFYYEIGECHEIGNAGLPTRYHKGYQDQVVGTIPAIIQLRNEGDIYYKHRFIQNAAHAIVSHMVEDFNFSDFYISDHVNSGRVNVHDLNIKEIRRPTVVYHSEIFIPDSNINGLSSIFGDSFKEYDQSNGSIQKLYTENKRLICFQELKVGMILINESVMYDQKDTSSILKSQKILSDIIYYSGEFGIGLEPGSFAVYGKSKYFVDVSRGAALRLSQDGITPISQYKMHNHFTDRFKEIKESGINGELTGFYDIKFKEYVLSTPVNRIVTITGNFRPGQGGIDAITFGNIDISHLNAGDELLISFFDRRTNTQISATVTIFSVQSGYINIDATELELSSSLNEMDDIFIKGLVASIPFETIAFNELTNRWSTFYSYKPDTASRAGIGIVTFKDGKLYKHNDNIIYNNFYGVQYNSKLEFVANENPSAVKFFLGIEEESNDIWVMPRATNLDDQQTSLIKEDFEKIEGVFWAAFLKDENSNGGLLEGEDIRGHALSVRLENDKTVFQKLFVVGIRSELSQRTNV